MSRPGGFRPFQPLGASATSNVTTSTGPTGAPKRPRPRAPAALKSRFLAGGGPPRRPAAVNLPQRRPPPNPSAAAGASVIDAPPLGQGHSPPRKLGRRGKGPGSCSPKPGGGNPLVPGPAAAAVRSPRRGFGACSPLSPARRGVVPRSPNGAEDPRHDPDRFDPRDRLRVESRPPRPGQMFEPTPRPAGVRSGAGPGVAVVAGFADTALAAAAARCRARGRELRSALASPSSTGEDDIAAVGDAIAAFELPKAMLEAALAESKAARLRRMA